MSNDNTSQILEAIKEIKDASDEYKIAFEKHIKEQKELDEKRLKANWDVYRDLRSRINDLNNSVEPVLQFIQDASGAKKFGVVAVKITLGLSAVLIALTTIGIYGKKIILFIIK